MRVALIHATKVAIDPIQQAFAQNWPEAEVINVLDDSLSIDRASRTVSPAILAGRIEALAQYARQTNCSAILYTCTAFGDMIEETARSSSIPVLKPNQAMFEEALKAGNNICMLYTFEAAKDSMEKEFYELATDLNPGASITSYFVDDALDLLNNGDENGHNQRVADKAKELTGFDGLILAQFSTARAATLTREKTSIPVFTSPESAVTKIRTLMQHEG